MKSNRFSLLLAAGVLFLTVTMPKTTLAVDLSVNPADPLCTQASTPPCFPTIQAAIDFANNILTGVTATTATYKVLVEPGAYPGGITLHSNISIQGRETARTIIGGGAEAAITAPATVTNVNVSNFTFIDSTVGIDIADASITINNNIFAVGTSGTAVQIQAQLTTGTTVVNNTFILNGTAISSNADITIKNNIFSGNTTALIVQPPLAALTQVSFNCFHNNGLIDNVNFVLSPSDPQASTNIPNTLQPLTDPLFVDESNFPPDMDLHFIEGSPQSPCIDRGKSDGAENDFDLTRNDIGAYGGPAADTIPFRVSQPDNLGITQDAPGSSSYTVNVAWDPNRSYLVTNSIKPGGYNLYYSANKTGPPYDTTQNVGNVVNSFISLLATTVTPSAPVLAAAGFANQTLKLSWSAVDGATGYTVFYTDLGSIDGSEPPIQTGEYPPVETGNVTSFDLTGLANNHRYQVQVSARAQSIYHIAVTAYDSTVGSIRTPGESHESAYSDELLLPIGDAVPSERSNAVIEFPESLGIVPSLPNSGCFIATAAYDSSSAPQVRVLRAFRDQYLLTNAAGEALVRWYYRHSPAAAQYLNERPEIKPLVRAALLPVVGGAMFMTEAALPVKVIVFLSLGVLVFSLLRRPQKKHFPK